MWSRLWLSLSAPKQGWREAAPWGYNPSVPPWTSPAAETPASLLLVRCSGGGGGFLLLGNWLMESPVVVGAQGILGWGVVLQHISSLQSFNIIQEHEAERVFVG